MTDWSKSMKVSREKVEVKKSDDVKMKAFTVRLPEKKWEELKHRLLKARLPLNRFIENSVDNLLEHLPSGKLPGFAKIETKSDPIIPDVIDDIPPDETEEEREIRFRTMKPKRLHYRAYSDEMTTMQRVEVQSHNIYQDELKREYDADGTPYEIEREG